MTQVAAPPDGAARSEDQDVPLLLPGPQFILAELSAMAMDGVLCPVYGQVFRPSSRPETPAVRAAALALGMPANLSHRAVLGQLSAAWVYGCGPVPAQIALLVDNDGNSVSLPRRSGCSVRQVHLGAREVCRVGSVQVTTALRTALDVARSAPRAHALPVLAALAGAPLLDCPLERIHQALLEAPHVPGKLRGTALVEAMLEGSFAGSTAEGAATS